MVILFLQVPWGTDYVHIVYQHFDPDESFRQLYNLMLNNAENHCKSMLHYREKEGQA